MEQQNKRYMVPTEFDERGNPRHIVVVDNEPDPAQVIHVPQQTEGWYPTRPVRTTTHIEGSYQDRAKAFTWATWQLAAITGLALVVVVRFFLEFPLLGWTAALIFFLGFLAVWLVSYALHTIVSPEGAELLEVVFLWRFLFNEQKERHRMYRPQMNVTVNSGSDRFGRLMLLLFAIVTVLFILAAMRGGG